MTSTLATAHLEQLNVVLLEQGQRQIRGRVVHKIRTDVPAQASHAHATRARDAKLPNAQFALAEAFFGISRRGVFTRH